MKNLLLLLIVIFLSSQAQALTVTFDNCVSGTSATNCMTGFNQLSVDVTDEGSNGTNNQVLFTFNNSGPLASSIVDVYFDDGSLLGIAGLIDADEGVGGSMGVDFSLGASPPNLPSANGADPDFEATAAFSSDSDSPVQPNGVNPGEMLGILFDLQGTQDFQDVINELISGALRIGIHVQGFGDGGSESFVNAPVPVPAAVWLLGSGMLAMVGFGRRRIV